MRIVDPTDERVPIRRTLAKRSGIWASRFVERNFVAGKCGFPCIQDPQAQLALISEGRKIGRAHV